MCVCVCVGGGGGGGEEGAGQMFVGWYFPFSFLLPFYSKSFHISDIRLIFQLSRKQ